MKTSVRFQLPCSPPGITPITVWLTPLSTSVRPRTPGSRPKRRSQKPSPSRTTPSAPGLSSAAEKPRPRTGGLPRVANAPEVTWRPFSRSGSSTALPPTALRMKSCPLYPTIDSNTEPWSRTSLKFATEKLISGTCSDHSVRSTSRSASGYGRGRRRIALITLKIAVLAPMPSARVRTATRVKAGVRRRARVPKRTSRHSSSIVVLLVVGMLPRL